MFPNLQHLQDCITLLDREIGKVAPASVEFHRENVRRFAENVALNYVVDKKYFPDQVDETVYASVCDALGRAADHTMDIPDVAYADIEKLIVRVRRVCAEVEEAEGSLYF